jgi:hypothetical protein
MTNPERMPITSNDIDTDRDENSSPRTAQTRPVAVSTDGQSFAPNGLANRSRPGQYLAAMTTSARTVITAIESLHPGWSNIRKHNMLFFVQGHCLTTFGTPMFAEPLHATTTGTAADLTDPIDGRVTLTGRQIGLLDWVLGRYEHVFPVDLQSLIQISTAWQLARQDDRHHIEHVWLTDWFSRDAERNDEGRPTGAEIDATAAALRIRAEG